MSLSNYLSVQELLKYNRSLSLSDFESEYLDSYISSLNSLITRKLGVVTGKTQKYYRKHASSVVWVDAWQKTAVAGGSDLVIKKGTDGTNELITLTEGTDFRFEFSEPDTSDNIVIGVILYSNYLDSNKDYLQLEGEKGLFDTIPDELALLKYDFYSILKKKLFSVQNENENQGKGAVTSYKMGDVSTSYDVGSEQGRLNHRQAQESIEHTIDNVIEQWTNYQDYSASIVG
jgi:hypothetical protein